MTTTTATKTQKACEECGQPGATGRYLTIDGEKLYAQLHKDCKKTVEARAAATAHEYATETPATDLIYGCDAVGSAWIRANVGLD